MVAKLRVSLPADDTFVKKVKTIQHNLDKHGLHLLLHNKKKKYEEFQRKLRCHNVRLKESMEIMKLFQNDRELYQPSVLEFAEKSSSLQKEDSDEFYIHQKNWMCANELMINNNEAINEVFFKRGMKIMKATAGCLYIFLEAESVEKLDSFWNQYQEGTLTNDFRRLLFSGGTSDFTLTIKEDNYKKYRAFLGKFFYELT